MEAYALFLLGVTMGVAGLAYTFFRANKRRPHEIMLGVAMSIIGWTMGAVGGLIVLLS